MHTFYLIGKKIMNKKVILTARGEQSFNKNQIGLLRNESIDIMKSDISLHKDDLINIYKTYEIIGLNPRSFTHLNSSEIPKNVKCIHLPTTGYHWFNVKDYLAKGITVTYVPSFSGQSCAEMTMGLILNASRKISSRLGYKNSKNLIGFDLKGKTLGLIGYGDIGKRVSIIAKSFRMKVLYYDILSSNSTLNELLKKSDVLSLHIPISEKNKNFIDKDKLDLLKENVIFINTARPGLVNYKDLSSYLLRNTDAQFYIDQGYYDSNCFYDCVEYSNFHLFPHVSWYTVESIENEKYAWIDNFKYSVSNHPNKINVE